MLVNQSAEMGAVADLLAGQMTAPIFVLSNTFDALFASGQSEATNDRVGAAGEYLGQPRLQRILAAAAETGRAVRVPDTESGGSVLIAPILVGSGVAAYVIAPGTADEDTSAGL